RESFSLLPQNLAEIGHPNTLGDGSQDSLSIVKIELSAELSDEIKPLLAKQAIFVSGHFASWEVACIALNRQMSHPVVMPVRALPFASLEKIVLKNRIRCGRDVQFLTRNHLGDTWRGLRSALKNGSSIALLADQRTPRGVKGKLLNQDAILNDIPARLSLLSGAPVVMFRAQTQPNKQYILKLGPVFLPPKTNSPQTRNTTAQLMTQQINDVFSTWIKESPSQWMWNRRRWKP
ncbi:MAG: lysophospholipid acyltransferase family protein, partial [Alphaproteobacteria bacterium]